jgi:hypothetical protein
MDRTLTFLTLYNQYKTDFNVAVKDAYSNVVNSKQFREHSEYLEMEQHFNEIIYLTSYETFGKMDDTVKGADMDNKNAFIRIKTIVNKFARVYDKLKTNLTEVIKLLDNKKLKPGNLKDQIDFYRLTSAISSLKTLQEQLRTHILFMDSLKALLSFEFQPDVNYSLKNLTYEQIHEYIEKKERDKIRRNISSLEQQKAAANAPQKKLERIIIRREKETDKINFDDIAVFCGNKSSTDTLSSEEQYINAIRKTIKKEFDDIRQKRYILPKFHFVLKEFVYNKIKRDMEVDQILYLISKSGDMIYPFDMVREMTDRFFAVNTKEYKPNSNDYAEQAKLIEDNIFFEIASIENQYLKGLPPELEKEKANMILSYFNRENLDLYRFLLPPTKTIQSIVDAYLRS